MDFFLGSNIQVRSIEHVVTRLYVPFLRFQPERERIANSDGRCRSTLIEDH